MHIQADVFAVEASCTNPELIIMLQPTSPIRQYNDIDNAIKKLKAEGADSLYSCRHVEGYIWDEDQQKPHPRTNRQDRKDNQYEENGSIYVFTPRVLAAGNRHGGHIARYEMHLLDSYQVDSEEDFNVVELLAKYRLDL